MNKDLYFVGMIGNLQSNGLRTYQFFWLSILFIGLLYSGTFLVLSMIMLLLPSIFYIRLRPFQIRINADFLSNINRFIADRSYFIITFVFWVSLFSVFNSKDTSTWWFFTSMKLPFVLFTFALFCLPAFTKEVFQKLILVFVLILFISSFKVLIPFFEEPASLRAIILKGQSIPTPVDHIKYSLFLSFGIIAGILVLFNRTNLIFKGEKIILTLILAYLFIFIHLIAVRSGIIILYVNLAIYFLNLFLSKKRYLLSGLAALILISLPVVAYLSLPTFRAKVQYSIKDYQMSSQNKEMAYSDGERLRSYQIGWELFESNPITGVGVGDVFKEYADLYEIKYFTKNPTYLPHNQFLTMAVSTGVVGLMFFTLSFFFPFAYRGAWTDPFLKALFVLILLSFMVENTIERQYSVGFYLVFLVMGLKQFFAGQSFKTAKNP